MPRSITVKFADGSSHVYANAPDNITPEQATERASRDFGKVVVSLDGGATPSPSTPAPAPRAAPAPAPRAPAANGWFARENAPAAPKPQPKASPGWFGRERYEPTPVSGPFGYVSTPQTPGTGKTLLHSAERGVVPALTGAAGFAAGASAAGSGLAATGIDFGGPWGWAAHAGGTLIGGLVGAFGGGMAGDYAQEKALAATPEEWKAKIGQDTATRQQEHQDHPTAEFIGSMAPQLLVMRPGLAPRTFVSPETSTLAKVLLSPTASRLAGGAMGGGVEAGKEYLSGENLDMTKIGIATTLGLALNRPTKLGKAIFNAPATVSDMYNDSAFARQRAIDADPTALKPARVINPQPMAPEASPPPGPVVRTNPEPIRYPAPARAPAPAPPVVAPQPVAQAPISPSGDGLGQASEPDIKPDIPPAPLRPEPGPLAEGERIVRTPAGAAIRTRMGVVDASQLTQAEGANQNRDRGRDTTTLQVQDIISKFDPELLHEDPSSDRGAPIIGPDGSIDSGNGRVLTLNQIYDQHPELAAKYRAMIEGRGFDTTGMERPVLVQHRMTEMTPEQRRQFVIDSNKDTKLELSPVERAQSDADSITPEMLATYAGGDLNSTANAAFVQKFNENLTTGELGGMIGSDRRITPAGAQRIENAVVAHAYGEPKLLERMMESSHDEIRSITGSLADVAGPWARMRADVKSGEIDPSLDITPQLVDAAARVADARKRGIKPADMLTQADAFDPLDPVTAELIRAFHNPAMTRSASRKAVSAFLQDYIDAARSQQSTPGLFGEVETQSPLSIAKHLLEQRDNPNGAGLALENGKEPTHDTIRTPHGHESRDAEEARGQEEGPRDRGKGRASDVAESRGQGGGEGVAESRGTGTPAPGAYSRTHAKGATTDRASDLRSAVEHLGMSWDEFNLKAAPTQMQLLQRAIGEKLGIKVTVDHSGKGASKGAIPYRVAIDQMLDAFHNITGMAAVLGLPEKAMSLGGTLTLHLQKSASFYGAFYPGEQKIALPGRSNSFAHEWGHALDFYLLGKHTSGEGRGLSGRTRQKGASGVQPTEMAGHFANLMNAMFFDRAGLATKIMALEAKAAAASSPSVKAQIGKQIQRIVEGAGQHRDGRSNFYAGAKGYHAPSEEYWTSPTEMMARSFEAYVAAKAEAAGMSTEVISHSDADYLSDADERLAKTFPKGEERNAIFSAFDDLFDGLVRSEELGAGKAAEVPDNPARRPDATPERVSALRNIVNAELAPWRDAARSRSKAAGQPKDRKGILSKAEDMRRYLFSSMAAELRGLGRRWKSKTIAELHDMLVPEAGRGNRLQGRDYVAAKRLRGQRYSNLIERALKQAGPNTLEKGKATTLTKEQAADVRLMMVNEHYFAMFPELQPLASRLREISDGIWHDLRNAGFDIGYTRNGHLPRIYDVPKAEVDMPGFVAAATEVYKAAGLSKDEARAAAGDWYFRLTAGNPHSFDQHSPAGDFLKGRTLPPDADVLMADFMVNEPIDLMHRYAASAAQRIEWAQRFGVDNSKLNKMYDQMAREGVDRRDIATIATMMDIMAGQNPLRQKNPTLNAAGAWFNTIYSTVALLPRAVFQSGAEAITASAVMENPVYGVKGMIDLVAGALGTASAKERREIGELIGLIDIGNSTRLMSDRFGGSYDDPLPVQKISASLFTRTGLIALTRAQKTHGMGTANAYLIHLSRNLLKAKPESADAREVQARFNELGIRDAEGFAKWMTSHGGSIMGFGGKMPAKAELTAGLEENGTAPWAHDWITAQRRLSDRVIQDPHEMTKPMLSHAGNIGRLLTGIQAFNYSFYENVIKPVVKRAAERGSDGRYSHAAWKAIVGGLLGFASIYVGQLLFTTLRVYLTDRERWNAEEAKGNLSKYLSRRTLSGFGTPVDPLVQAVTGLKYRRPLGASVEGPAAGNFLANMSDVIALGFASNSRTTNTSEYNALNGAYRLLSPWASAATTAVPGGPLANAAMGMGQGYITSPQAGKDFATTIVGPKNRTVGEDGEKVKSGPTAYDIWLDKHYPKPPKK